MDGGASSIPGGETTAPSDAAGLTLSEVSKRYGAVTALDAVSLRVKRGEFLTLLGPSGSGKTTLLMIIAGFVAPTAGAVTLDGRSILHEPPESRDFGMVFQGYALFPHMSVAGNIAYPLEVRKKRRSEIDERVRAMLELVQLNGLAKRKPRQLSGGQQQRVALARALSFDPQILLLDEPLGALDKKLRMEVQLQLKQLHREVGVTFIYVTHDQEEALSMSDRVAILNQGRLVQIGTPTALYERPATVFAASFLGKSNFLRGRVRSVEADRLVYEVDGVPFVQSVDSATERPESGAVLTLALRPEKITLASDETAANTAPGVVIDTVYFGPNMTVTVDAGPLGRLFVETPTWRRDAALEPGAAVTLRWSADAAAIVADDDPANDARNNNAPTNDAQPEDAQAAGSAKGGAREHDAEAGGPKAAGDAN